MTSSVVIEGGDDILRKLRSVGAEMERAQEVILRAAGDVIARTAADNVRDVSATVADNIDVQKLPEQGVVIGVGPKKTAWYAHMIERGTPPHRIEATSGKRLRFQKGETVYYRRSVMHPGTKKHPFLNPAAEAKKDDASRAAADKAEDVLRRAASK